MKNSKSGFTLLEILLVVGIIAILAGIVIVAINPARQLAQTRNAERRSDLKQLYSAMNQYYIDYGHYPATSTLDFTLKEVCDTGTLSSPSGLPCTGLIDLSELVPTYITAIPKDPTGPLASLPFIETAYAAAGGTGYILAKDPSNKIVMAAPQAEAGAVIALGTSTMVGGGTSGCVATGGTETTVSGYKIHTFTNIGSDTFTVNSGLCDVEVLVVAGGGGGGMSEGAGGGGGAGGLIYDSSFALTSQTYSVTVGNGGIGAPYGQYVQGSDGENSVFSTLIAYGGGGGGGPGGIGSGNTGRNGGSGGGGSYGFNPGGTGVSGQGFAGGTGSDHAGNVGSGGGGGAGGVGSDGVTSGPAANGGEGVFNSISGSSVCYAGGGGGSAHYVAGGIGGCGGGTGAATYGSYPEINATSGTENTGGGGGGGGYYLNDSQSNAGVGGSGIVIVRYAI